MYVYLVYLIARYVFISYIYIRPLYISNFRIFYNYCVSKCTASPQAPTRLELLRSDPGATTDRNAGGQTPPESRCLSNTLYCFCDKR